MIEDWNLQEEIHHDAEENECSNLWSDAYNAPGLNSERAAEKSDNRKVEDWKRREERVLADPKVKEFMDSYQKALDTGKIDQDFLNKSREMGKRCLEDYDVFYTLWCKLNEKGIHLSIDKNGVTFARTEYLGGTDGIGHPAIPWGETETSLSIPFGAGQPEARSTTSRRLGGPLNTLPESSKIDPTQATEAIFKPRPEPVREFLDLIKQKN